MKKIFLVLMLSSVQAYANPGTTAGDLPMAKDLTQSSNAQKELDLTGAGFSAHVKIHPEKSEYLFSFDVEKAKSGTNYEISLVEACNQKRSSANESNSYLIGDFKGVRGGLLTEFFVRRDKVSGTEGNLKYGYLAVAEKNSKGFHQVSCRSIVN